MTQLMYNFRVVPTFVIITLLFLYAISDILYNKCQACFGSESDYEGGLKDDDKFYKLR